jgi:hypothetical protein
MCEWLLRLNDHEICHVVPKSKGKWTSASLDSACLGKVVVRPQERPRRVASSSGSQSGHALFLPESLTGDMHLVLMARANGR